MSPEATAVTTRIEILRQEIAADRVAPVAGAALDRFEAFLRAALERLATAWGSLARLDRAWRALT